MTYTTNRMMGVGADMSVKAPTPITPLNGAIQRLLDCCGQAESIATNLCNSADKLIGPQPPQTTGPQTPDGRMAETPLIVKLDELVGRLERALVDINAEVGRISSL